MATPRPDRPLPQLRRTPLFRERRKLSAGPAGWTIVLGGLTCMMLALLVGGAWTWPLLVAACLLIAAGATFSVDLVVMPVEVRVVWWRIFVRHRVPLQDIQQIDVVVSDNLVGFFGGYNSRTSMASAMVRGAEGDQSVGSRAMRIVRGDGRVLQVGCWQPTRFCEAVEAARAQRRT